MNNNDVLLVKESIDEYCNNIYAECLWYMKENNIDYNLTGIDELSLCLKKMDILDSKVLKENNLQMLLKYKNQILDLGNKVGNLVRSKWRG